MSGWQPIDSAPKGAPGFLACNAAEYDYIEWLLDNGEDRLFNVNSLNYTKREPWTHWMPLPAPPEVKP